MAGNPRDDLLGYLSHGREAVVWKLDGLGERDVRRPMTRTGTNLLGLVEHLAAVEPGCLGEVFDRPFPEPPERRDVVLEMVDGRAGRREGASNLPEQDEAGRAACRGRLQAVADRC